jgi:chromosome segregation ATPase
MAQTKAEKIESLKEQIEQLQNKQKRLLQEQKKAERTARTKRLCRRMGLIESMLPETIPLTEEQFKTFLEKTITTEQSRRILATAAQSAIAAPSQITGAALRSAATPAANQAATEQDGGNDGGEERGNGARVNG